MPVPGPWRLWAALAVAGAAAAGLVGAGIALHDHQGKPGDGDAGQALPVAVPAAVTAPRQNGPAPAYIATLSEPTPYGAAPGGTSTGTLAATNPFGAPQVLALIDSPDGSGWLHVELPVRPNGTTGWIPARGVAISETFYRVAVSLAARTLTVTDAGRVVLTTPVGIGAQHTPTPPGDTYIWELVRPDDPGGAYGPYIFGLAEFSTAYSAFNGGDAQIGIHGQDKPGSIGQAASNGCVRLPNDVVTQLAGLLPLGTPVSIA
ncbi:MAG: L,D-transpeptidase [Acidimicrobiales bacterium]|nr:L,D-transpeptidase [Acidimicrobiales bacterium]